MAVDEQGRVTSAPAHAARAHPCRDGMGMPWGARRDAAARR
jgi:hypothetical protein